MMCRSFVNSVVDKLLVNFGQKFAQHVLQKELQSMKCRLAFKLSFSCSVFSDVLTLIFFTRLPSHD